MVELRLRECVVQSLEREEAKVSIARKNLWHQGESSREKT
jgi:hypothetical protein